MRETYLVFGRPLILDEEIEGVVASLRAGWLGTGPKVYAFEKAVAAYKRSPHAVALNSCTAGLHLACLVLGIGPGDEVIVPAMTFCATVNAIIHAGATPVLVDVDPTTFNIDAEQVRRAITPRTRAIMVVHFAGRACDMDAILHLAQRHGLKVIEDCAHAVETEFHGRKAGTLGDCGLLSFYSTKNVITGEGGMLLTADADLAARVRVLASHGLSANAWARSASDDQLDYEVIEIGYKYNMTDLQAAIGLPQIARVEENWARRLLIWETYNNAFADLPIELPAPLDLASRHGLHLYTVRVHEETCGLSRDRLRNTLHRRNVGTGVHYRAISAYKVYRDRFGWDPDDVPVARDIGETILSLPLSPQMSDADVASVIDAIRIAL